MVKQYKKRPVVIEAMQYNYSEQGIPRVAEMPKGTVHSWMQSHGNPGIGLQRVGVGYCPVIQTLEGLLQISDGDWIIKGVNGEFYPCKPDIFAKTYDVVAEDDSSSVQA